MVKADSLRVCVLLPLPPGSLQGLPFPSSRASTLLVVLELHSEPESDTQNSKIISAGRYYRLGGGLAWWETEGRRGE